MRSITFSIMALTAALTVSSPSSTFAKDDKAPKKTFTDRLATLKEKLKSDNTEDDPVTFAGQGGLNLFGVEIERAPFTQEELDEQADNDGE